MYFFAAALLNPSRECRYVLTSESSKARALLQQFNFEAIVEADVPVRFIGASASTNPTHDSKHDIQNYGVPNIRKQYCTNQTNCSQKLRSNAFLFKY